MKLTIKDQEKIKKSIKDAESMTAAEIAWKIVDRSSSYSDASWTWVFVMILIGLVYQSIMTTNTSWNGDVISFIDILVFGLIGLLMSKIPFCRRFIISDKRMHRRALEKARASFLAGGVHLTEKHNGTLIYVSVFERISILITDQGIDITAFPTECYFATGSAAWDKKEKLVEEMISYIRSLGGYFCLQFPRGDKDVNEVSDDNLTDN